MKVVAIMGSYRKGKTIDALVDQAIEGFKAAHPGAEVEKIVLTDKNIDYCRGCGACRRDEPAKPIAQCVIKDDMQDLLPKMRDADAYIFGSPIFDGTVTAVMKAFLERTSLTLARAGRWPIKGCPEPRESKKKRAILISSSGIVPPLFRRFCDDSTKLIKDHAKCMLNARLAGSLYAGGVEKVGMDRYLDKARTLGAKLAA